MDAWDEPAGLVGRFAKDQGIRYPVLLGGSKVAERFGVDGIPATFYIDREGKVVSSEVGFPGEAAMERAVQEILKDKRA